MPFHLEPRWTTVNHGELNYTLFSTTCSHYFDSMLFTPEHWKTQKLAHRWPTALSAEKSEAFCECKNWNSITRISEAWIETLRGLGHGNSWLLIASPTHWKSHLFPFLPSSWPQQKNKGAHRQTEFDDTGTGKRSSSCTPWASYAGIWSEPWKEKAGILKLDAGFQHWEPHDFTLAEPLIAPATLITLLV